jgi:hypothetical protein
MPATFGGNTVRIRAVYNFYLDFMLPRIDNRDGIKVKTTLDGCDAWIYTWGSGEPLFPAESDQTLSSISMELKPIVRLEIAIRREAKSRILDRISVTLEWEQDISPVEDKSITDAYLERAVFGANSLLEHIRVSNELIEMRKISRSWDPIKSEISVTVPHTQSWFDADTGKGLPVFMGKNSLGNSEGIRIGPVPVTTVAQLSRTLTGDGPRRRCI